MPKLFNRRAFKKYISLASMCCVVGCSQLPITSNSTTKPGVTSPAANPASATPASANPGSVESETDVPLSGGRSGSLKKLDISNVQKKAATDAAFKAKLVADPKAVLIAEGFDLKANEKVRVLDITPESIYMVLDDRNLEKLHPMQTAKEDKKEINQTEKKLVELRGKALSDANFKAELLANPTKALTETGLPEVSAKNYKFLDYEPNTHYLVLLPGAFFASSEMSTKQVLELLIEPLVAIVTPVAAALVVGIVAEIIITILRQIVRDPSVSHFAVDGAFYAVEGFCWWPRLFGYPCGASKPQIAQTILMKNFGVSP